VSYYDLPVVKAPPWTWTIPAYFYVGGVAGASATLHGAIKLARQGRELTPLVGKLRWLSMIGEAISGGLLIADLGRPERFHHMLRGFRPKSPMSVGTWILSAAGATSAIEVARNLLGSTNDGLTATSAINMVAGAGLTTYTGVLVGNTALPVWRAIRVPLPALFAASAGASAASVLELLGASSRGERRLVRRFSIATKTSALVASLAVQRAAGAGIVGAPLREGTSGTMWRWSQVLGAASLAATVLRQPRIAGVLGTVAGVTMRYAIAAAGQASAAEARATLDPG